MLIDITRTIGIDTITYPGDAAPQLERTDSLSRGDSFNGTHLHLSAHCGTHIDAPSHFLADGAAIAEFPLERFNPRVYVVDTGDALVVRAEHVAGLAIKPGEAVLFKTANANLPRDSFSPDYVYLGMDVVQLLIERGVGLIGIDYLSVDKNGDSNMPAHHALLGVGMLILEDADLRSVNPGRYRLYCFPLRLHDTEASPVRAILAEL